MAKGLFLAVFWLCFGSILSKSILERVFKGRKDESNNFPSSCWVEYNGNLQCGAVLVSKDLLVTLAECVTDQNVSLYRVVIGDLRYKKSSNEEFITPKQFIVHPEYNDTTGQNNIAWIRLSQDAGLAKDNIGLVSTYNGTVATYKDEEGTDCVLSSYGARFASGLYQYKQALNVVLRDNGDCSGLTNFIPGDHFCHRAKKTKKGYKACHGDKGSPIMCQFNADWVMIGLEIEDGCTEMFMSAVDFFPYLEMTAFWTNNYKCPDLYAVNNGDLVPSDAVYIANVTAQLTCDEGYVPSNENDTITCQDDGEWSTLAAECLLSCGTPTFNAGNGTFEMETDMNLVNETATLVCSSNYVLSSNNTDITCQEDGNWTTIETECLSMDECASGPCQNDGTCTNLPGNFTCECPDNWQGDLCDEDVDECVSSPCLNDATCNNINGSFTCDCPSEWDGKLCGDDVDECVSSPCLNDATCNNINGSFTCDCPSEWEGELCGDDVDECVSSPCLNDATCNNINGSFTCDCPSEWEGELCGDDVDECVSSPCLNDATCNNINGSFTCDCPSEWEGELCGDDVDECVSSPCLNDATCNNINGSFTCDCPSEWEGELCGDDVDECVSSPCLNDATCNNINGSFTCDCPSEWEGELCGDDVDECVSSPCLNDATCNNINGSFTCDCPSEWEGELCGDDVDECVSSPCLNDATCNNINGSFTCDCPSEWEGELCGDDVDECVSSPCLNDATCNNINGSFTCDCPSEWEGELCGDALSDPISCDFESSSICGYMQDTTDQFQWTRAIGATPSLNTGPSNDHTYGTAKGHYMFIEVSAPRIQGDIAKLVSKSYTFTSGSQCLEFWYNMFGISIGTLNVYLQAPGGSKGTPAFTKQGNQGNSWKRGQISLTPGSAFLVVFEGIRGASYQGDIAIDDVAIKQGSCGGTPDVDECVSSPCLNDATCNNINGSFTCDCPSEWEGELCGDDVDECVSSPCLNDATCNNLNGSFTCDCPSEWEGELCGDDVDECVSSPCLNDATCNNVNGSFTCDCPSEWEGELCGDDVDECVSSPCLNDATCNNLNGSFTCDCPSEWEGELCGDDVDECVSSPCLNDATCNNVNGSFTCDCPSEWEGELCGDDVDECVSSPCLNDATCNNLNGSFTCDCPSEWEGELCGDDVDECNLTVCLNDSACTNIIGGFECSCPPGFYGITCENSCEPLPIIPYGSYQLNASALGTDAAQLVCDDPYVESHAEIICNENGTWSEVGNCSLDCGPTPPRRNGTFVQDGLEATLECDYQFELMSFDTDMNDTIYCEPNGRWTHKDVYCVLPYNLSTTSEGPMLGENASQSFNPNYIWSSTQYNNKYKAKRAIIGTRFTWSPAADDSGEITVDFHEIRYLTEVEVEILGDDDFEVIVEVAPDYYSKSRIAANINNSTVGVVNQYCGVVDLLFNISRFSRINSCRVVYHWKRLLKTFPTTYQTPRLDKNGTRLSITVEFTASMGAIFVLFEKS